MRQLKNIIQLVGSGYQLILPALIFAVTLAIGILHAGTISNFPTVSLRYNTPISGTAAFRARQHSIENTAGYTFWPTFWHQCTAVISTNIRETNAHAISFSGDAKLVWPATYINGTAPSAVDARGIAVSHALAHRLWGSVNIIGLPVYVNGTPRFVRGVFEGDIELALVSFHIEDTTPSFSAVELAGGNPTRTNVENYATTSGLGRPHNLLLGSPVTFARVLAIIPLFIPGMYLLVLTVKFAKAYFPQGGVVVIFTVLLLLAIFLPTLLDALPLWLIPTRWSDFAFWSGLVNDGNYALRSFLSVSPTLRDVELKLLLIRQVGIFIVTIGAAVWFSCTTSRVRV